MTTDKEAVRVDEAPFMKRCDTCEVSLAFQGGRSNILACARKDCPHEKTQPPMTTDAVRVDVWRDIKTDPPPKDGTEFLAWGKRCGGTDFPESEPMMTQMKYWPREKFFSETVCTPRYYAGFKATHWMQLPAPPTQEGEKL